MGNCDFSGDGFKNWISQILDKIQNSIFICMCSDEGKEFLFQNVNKNNGRVETSLHITVYYTTM